MKKIILISILFLTFLFVVSVGQSNAQVDTNNGYIQVEKVDSFNTNIIINDNSSFTVEETIVYNFGDSEYHHGIYRYVPYSYTRDGNKYSIKLKVKKVVDDVNHNLPYTISKSNGKLNIQIGDADKYVTGQKTYIIIYEVRRAINYFDDHDELFWNVTGNGWKVNLDKVTASVTLPRAVKSDDMQLACYTGYYGSDGQDCSYNNIDNTYNFSTDKFLSSSEGLTIILGWPKGITNKPDSWQVFLWFMSDNWPIFFPIVIFIIMFFLWYVRGRDPKINDTIIPFYEAPNKMTAGELGTVIDEKVDLKDISASIIQLAVKGYIKIREIDQKKLLGKSKDYELIKLKEADNNLIDFEKLIFKAIFGEKEIKKVSELKNKFYIHLTKIKKSIYELVVTNGYFPANPEKVRNLYRGIATFIIFLGTFILSSLNNNVGSLTFISVFISAIITISFSGIMPRKTKKGAKIHKEILGFKWFLSVTEKERLKFHNAPEKSPKSFEENLPYAMVLGVEKEWAGQFDDIYLTPPDWYEGSTMNTFGALYLVNSLNSMSNNVNSVIKSRPNSAGGGTSGFGGGGFSGGGFGGGGGGSW